jgi:RimJ/RimL family protein N-acetyltransferase
LRPDERLQRIAKYRRQTLVGDFVDLVPMRPDHAQAVIDLRNTDRARFFLAQRSMLTLESHADWYRGYLARADDLSWVIASPRGEIVGITALYDIAADGSTAEKGRLVIDENRATAAPIALEAELLILRLAFDTLQVATVLTIVQPGNGKMISVNSRMGFQQCGTRELRSVPYNEYCLSRKEFTPAPLEKILQHWKLRNERGKA